jgi:hypothetical protein
MKKKLLVLSSLLIAVIISMVFIISCNKDNAENTINSNKQFFTGFVPDSVYVYRSKADSSYGDSTFKISIKYNSSWKIHQISVELVASEPGDLPKSYIFVNDSVYDYTDSLYYSWESNEEDIWMLELGDDYLIDVDPNNSGGHCDWSCKCSCDDNYQCFLIENYDYVSGCWDCFCAPNDVPGTICPCACNTIVHTMPTNTTTNDRVVLIQTDKIRFNQTNYD